jgi:hypothetical protein
MTSTFSRLREAGRHQHQAYSGEADRPLGGYVLTMGAYATAVTAVAATVRRTGRRLPEQVSPWDVGLIAAATYKVSRLVAKAPVTSPLRAPFTEFQGSSGPAELAEAPRGHGPRHAVGELMTCPFCVGQWVATGLVTGLIFRPRATRLVTAMFTALAGADLLQFLRARAEQGNN